MRINLLSSFAAGILITTTIVGTVYFTGNSDVSKASSPISEPRKTVKVQPTEIEMKSQLETKGYVIQTKAEYDKTMIAAKTPAQKAVPEKTTSAKAVTKVVVNVTDGMTSIDIGKMLVTAKIVPNAFDFSKKVEQKKVENKLRPGVFAVDSGMSVDQVIGTIFK